MYTLLYKTILGIVVVFLSFSSTDSGTDVAESMRMLNKLTVGEEERCSPHERKKHYSYSQSIEPDVVQ